MCIQFVLVYICTLFIIKKKQLDLLTKRKKINLSVGFITIQYYFIGFILLEIKITFNINCINGKLLLVYLIFFLKSYTQYKILYLKKSTKYYPYKKNLWEK